MRVFVMPQHPHGQEGEQGVDELQEHEEDYFAVPGSTPLRSELVESRSATNRMVK
tara:strand:- start:192 stop:356 length:165 start_codon:yes stop_codon:yes gene_type:complete